MWKLLGPGILHVWLSTWRFWNSVTVHSFDGSDSSRESGLCSLGWGTHMSCWFMMFKSGQPPTWQESSSNGSGSQARSQAGCFLVVSVFCWTNVLAVYVFCVLPNECFSLRMPYFAFLFPRGTLWGTVPWCLCWRTRQALVLGSETLWDKEGWTPTVQPDSCYLIGNPGDTFHCFPQQPQWKKHSKKKKSFPLLPSALNWCLFQTLSHCPFEKQALIFFFFFFWLFPDIIISVFRTFSPSVSVILENDLANRAMKMH